MAADSALTTARQTYEHPRLRNRKRAAAIRSTARFGVFCLVGRYGAAPTAKQSGTSSSAILLGQLVINLGFLSLVIFAAQPELVLFLSLGLVVVVYLFIESRAPMYSR